MSLGSPLVALVRALPRDLLDLREEGPSSCTQRANAPQRREKRAGLSGSSQHANRSRGARRNQAVSSEPNCCLRAACDEAGG